MTCGESKIINRPRPTGTILIVDDTPANLGLPSSMLGTGKFKSLETASDRLKNAANPMYNLVSVVRIESALDADMPEDDIHITTDGVYLKETLANLVGNAIRYTPDQGTVGRKAKSARGLSPV